MQHRLWHGRLRKSAPAKVHSDEEKRREKEKTARRSVGGRTELSSAGPLALLGARFPATPDAAAVVTGVHAYAPPRA
jgi:hypothetical protein